MKDIKKRDMYAVSFIKVVDSAWKPNISAHLFRSERSGGNRDYLRVKSSVGNMQRLRQIKINKFENREEFISFMAKEATDTWDNYEAEKKFDKECRNILDDIDRCVELEPNDIESDIEEWPERDKYRDKKDYYRSKLNVSYLTEEEARKKAQEIGGRDIGDSWKPYLALKEILGVDLLELPDTVTDEKMEKLKASRCSATDNNGIVRRKRAIGEEE